MDNRPVVSLRGALQSLKGLLTGWSPSEPVPHEAAALLPSAIEAAEQALVPAEIKALAVQVDRLFEFAELFGLFKRPSAESVARITRVYAASLTDMPSDLLVIAIDRLMRDYRWGGRMPLPADIRGAVSHELNERRHLARRLRVASLMPKQLPSVEREPMTSEQQAKFDAIVAGLKDQKPTHLRVVEKFTEDLAPASSNPTARVMAETKGFHLPGEDDPVVQRILNDLNK